MILERGPGCLPTTGAASLFDAYFFSILLVAMLPPLLSAAMLPPLMLPPPLLSAAMLPPLMLPPSMLPPFITPCVLPPCILSLFFCVSGQPTTKKVSPRPRTATGNNCQTLRTMSLLNAKATRVSATIPFGGSQADERPRPHDGHAEVSIRLDAGHARRLQGICRNEGRRRKLVPAQRHEAQERARRIAWISSSGASAGGAASSGWEKAPCSSWMVVR